MTDRPQPTPGRDPHGDDRRAAFHAYGPPAIGLLVSSPAIASALGGTTDPMYAATIVAAALVAAWVLWTVGLHLTRGTVPARIDPPTTENADDPQPRRGGPIA